MFAVLTTLLQDGKIPPPPVRTFPLAEAGAAFEFMAKALHIGRIAISHPATGALGIREDASYLVTGGRGALGMHVADWLVSKGATYIILMGRSEPDEATLSRINDIRSRGVEIEILIGDVADSCDLAIGGGSERPPVRGVVHAAGIVDDAILQHVEPVKSEKSLDWQALFFMLGLSLLVSSLSTHLGRMIAAAGLLNPMIWSIILATLAGMIAAPTKLGSSAASEEVSTIMLYVVVALIGAEVNLGALSEAPMYILSGFMILAVHAVLLILVARILQVDLMLVGIASIANIGSAPSAAVVAAAYDKRLVPVAVSMALIGSMLGSFVGLLVAEAIRVGPP
jgi:NAD(P)-dependent dehydrogenase (short-subunit alcohol dehydrogenase family)